MQGTHVILLNFIMPGLYFEFWTVFQPPVASSLMWHSVKRSLPFVDSCNYVAASLLIKRAFLAEDALRLNLCSVTRKRNLY